MTRGQAQRGTTLVEAMAALALLALAVTTSVSLLHDGSRFAARHRAAAVRLVTAERLMERTLATPFASRASRTIAPGAVELDGRRDTRASVTVSSIAPGLQRIEVLVRDGHSRTQLETLSAPWEGLR